ncbi:MAG: hypothetical protein ACJAXX_002320 [Roseivirga sp.]|jgi:hypothetical protein
MTKFFRPIRYHLMEKNIGGKYVKYAIGKIILVVGVLISLQINNWNENRKEGIKEQVILKSLRVNLKENLQRLNLAENSTVNAYHTSLNLPELITPDGSIINTSQIDRLLSVTLDYMPYDANRDTIHEIINAG